MIIILSYIAEKRKGIILILFTYIIYNINMRAINSGDTWPAAMLPFSILSQGTLYLDMFADFFQSLNFDPHMVLLSDGHFLSFYPIVIPVLITPFYIIPYSLFNLIHLPLNMLDSSFYLAIFILEKIFASLISVASVVFCYLSLKELIRREIAYICAAIYAFATNTWVTSSQALWQQGMVELILSVLIFLTIINEKNRSNINIIYMGILSGLFMFNRPSDTPLLLPFLVYVLLIGKRTFLYYLFFSVFSGFPFLVYNLYFFKNIFGGYTNLLSDFSLGTSILMNLSGLMISPSRGLLIYSPILILSLFGYTHIKEIDGWNLKLFLKIAGISILLQLLVYGSYRIWWAGHCYGPRFLVCILPFLVVYIGLFLNGWLRFDRIRGKYLVYLCLIGLLLIWSVSVQVIGAFCYPNGNWDGTPEDVDLGERLWDWNDNQITRSIQAGPIIVNPFVIFSIVFDDESLPQTGNITNRSICVSQNNDSFMDNRLQQTSNGANRSIGWGKLEREGIIGGLKGYSSAG